MMRLALCSSNQTSDNVTCYVWIIVETSLMHEMTSSSMCSHTMACLSFSNLRKHLAFALAPSLPCLDTASIEKINNLYSTMKKNNLCIQDNIIASNLNHSSVQDVALWLCSHLEDGPMPYCCVAAVVYLLPS